jgi:hypothetical protein
MILDAIMRIVVVKERYIGTTLRIRKLFMTSIGVPYRSTLEYPNIAKATNENARSLR